jgi:hypothetical protein
MHWPVELYSMQFSVSGIHVLLESKILLMPHLRHLPECFELYEVQLLTNLCILATPNCATHDDNAICNNCLDK